MAIEGGGKTVGKEPAPLDAFGHVIWKGALTEDGKAEKVDVDLSDPSPASPRWFRPHFHTSLGSMALTRVPVKEYIYAVPQVASSFARLRDGLAAQASHRHRGSLWRVAVFSFCRWLTCGHDHHRWVIQIGFPLDGPEGWTGIWKACHRCGLTEELE